MNTFYCWLLRIFPIFLILSIFIFPPTIVSSWTFFITIIALGFIAIIGSFYFKHRDFQGTWVCGDDILKIKGFPLFRWEWASKKTKGKWERCRNSIELLFKEEHSMTLIFSEGCFKGPVPSHFWTKKK